MFKSYFFLDFAGLESIALGILHWRHRQWGEPLCLPDEVLQLCREWEQDNYQRQNRTCCALAEEGEGSESKYALHSEQTLDWKYLIEKRENLICMLMKMVMRTLIMNNNEVFPLSGEICRISVLQYNVHVPRDYFCTFILSILCTNYCCSQREPLNCICLFWKMVTVCESDLHHNECISVHRSGLVSSADLGLR